MKNPKLSRGGKIRWTSQENLLRKFVERIRWGNSLNELAPAEQLRSSKNRSSTILHLHWFSLQTEFSWIPTESQLKTEEIGRLINKYVWTPVFVLDCSSKTMPDFQASTSSPSMNTLRHLTAFHRFRQVFRNPAKFDSVWIVDSLIAKVIERHPTASLHIPRIVTFTLQEDSLRERIFQHLAFLENCRLQVDYNLQFTDPNLLSLIRFLYNVKFGWHRAFTKEPSADLLDHRWFREIISKDKSPRERCDIPRQN